MCKFTIPDSVRLDNPGTDLDCPRCHALCRFTSARGEVACPCCSWTLFVSPQVAGEITDSLAGISPVPLAALLAYLDATVLTVPVVVSPPPNGGGRYPGGRSAAPRPLYPPV
jgi:hypothetical protein